MYTFYSISPIGELYVPTECRDSVLSRGSVKLFVNKDLDRIGRIFTHIQRGGVAVVEGKWEQISDLMDYIQQHKSELISSNTKKQDRGKSRERRYNPKQEREAALSRLMCWADQEGVLQVDPSPTLPFLLELIGEMPDSNEDCPFLVPVTTIQRIQSALETFYPIQALDASLVASENVLVPRSQETIDCFQEAMRSVKSSHSSHKPIVADVGCGSGCLTLLAQQEFGEDAEIYASDLLPEAVATTKINIQQIIPKAENVYVMPPCDLFETFSSDNRFDIIIFNAPWVVARVRSRAEIAIHDDKQTTLKRFFEQVSNHLKPDGTILLGYADASGPKAISNLEVIIEESGFICKNIYKRRVATHRSKRKYEHIQVYVLEKK